MDIAALIVCLLSVLACWRVMVRAKTQSQPVLEMWDLRLPVQMSDVSFTLSQFDPEVFRKLQGEYAKTAMGVRFSPVDYRNSVSVKQSDGSWRDVAAVVNSPQPALTYCESMGGWRTVEDVMRHHS